MRPHDMLQSLGSAGIDVTIEDLEHLANHVLPGAMANLRARLGWTAEDRALARKALGTDVGGARSLVSGPSFHEVPWSGQVFGPTPEGESLAGQVNAAHDVYVATLRGVLADLELFRSNLLDSIRKANEADLSAEEAMRRIARDGMGEYRMDAVQQRAVERHRDVLTPLVGHGSTTPRVAPEAWSDAEPSGAGVAEDPSAKAPQTSASDGSGADRLPQPPPESFEGSVPGQ